jgi:dTDP-4-amino-4,6-dideoxygalactose transaminase
MYVMGKREVDAVRKVIRSGELFRYLGGRVNAFTTRFERGLARKIGTRYAIATSSGTTSLVSALVGLGVGPGDEVIVPGYTFIATALAVVGAGAVPVLAEVDESLTLDPEDVRRKITRHTRAIIPVYMLGLPCDMAAILRLARRHGLDVLEDAAQAAGGSYRGRRFGSLGKAGALSFNHYKIIACGEGGALVTSDRTVFERAMLYHDGGCSFFLKKAPSVPIFAGLNFRISEVHSAILYEQLKRLDGILVRLRARKAAMADAVRRATAFRASPNHDPRGDCATYLPLLFESAREAIAFAKRHAGRAFLYRPIDTGRHVYSNWEAILGQRAHHRGASPWRLSGRRYAYAKDMLPRTLDVLARTVCVGVPLGATVAQARALARKFLG